MSCRVSPDLSTLRRTGTRSDHPLASGTRADEPAICAAAGPLVQVDPRQSRVVAFRACEADGVGRSGDGRWLHPQETRPGDEALTVRVRQLYPGIGASAARHVYSSVHDVAQVNSDSGRYALKVYRCGVRTPDEVRWEVDLHRHLFATGAPVPRPVAGAEGFVAEVELGGRRRWAVLSEWAPGAKPAPSAETYRLLGSAAAMIHAAAGDFGSSHVRPPRTVRSEVDHYLALLRPSLDRIGRWGEVEALGRRVSKALCDPLERGVCHNDLTLDNIHIDGDRLTVFDLDSAGEGWRAWEPQGVYQASILSGDSRWENWLAGYEAVRSMAEVDRESVPYFVLMAHLEHVAWKLGLTRTSVGQLLTEADLPGLVDGWSEWAAAHCLAI